MVPSSSVRKIEVMWPVASSNVTIRPEFAVMAQTAWI
jgi:hypothetical protein